MLKLIPLRLTYFTRPLDVLTASAILKAKITETTAHVSLTNINTLYFTPDKTSGKYI